MNIFKRSKTVSRPLPDTKNLKQAAIIGIVFGVIWAFGPSVKTSYSGVLQIIAVLLAVALTISLLTTPKTHSTKQEGLPDSYYTVLIIEAFIIAVGVFLFRNSTDTPYLIAWISAVVGVHFCALSQILGVRRQFLTGVLIIASSVLGAVLYATGATVGTSRNVTSFITAFVLLASAEIAIHRIRMQNTTRISS